jgi:LPXTG-motif cell wall-anchored protein
LTLPDSTTIETTTNANGLYLFSGLAAGEYKSELILSSIPKPSEGDLKLTTSGSFTIQLLDGQSYLDADFGVVATLPKTGLPTDVLALIGMMLLLAGTLALLATRKHAAQQG